MMSQSEENYLKVIYALQTEFGKGLSTNLIAKKIATKASSVTDMLKKLALKKLVVYKKYQGVHLTKKGSDLAKKVIRKHRLWETFLVNKLDFSWNEVHDIAEQLEHIKSDKLMDKLDTFLGYPKQDPHGDPIPDKNGKFTKNNSVNILELQIGTEGVLESVKDSSEGFLKYLNKKNMALGDKIKVIDIEPFDNSIHVEINAKQMILTQDIAKNLYLKNAK